MHGGRLGVTLAAAAVAACVPAPSGPARVEPRMEMRMYAPLAFRADANLPHQAVILGTDERTATILPLPGAPGAATSSARVERVVAALLDRDVAAVAPGSLARSAEAGAAVRRIAVITGDALDGKAAVVGALAPDGSLVSAGGEALALDAALAAGAKRVAVPADADLAARARARGAEVVVVADVREAYRVLAHRPLPEPMAVPETEMALDAAATLQLETRYGGWHAQVAARWALLVQLEGSGRLPTALVELRSEAKQLATRAEALHAHGQLAAATERMTAAAEHAAAASDLYATLARVRDGDLDGARALTDGLAHDAEAAQHAADELAATPTTLPDALARIGAFETASAAAARAERGTKALAAFDDALHALPAGDAGALRSPALADQLASQAAPVILDLDRAITGAARAKEHLGVGAPEGPSITAAIAALATAQRAELESENVHALSAGALDALVASAERHARQAARAAKVAIGSIPLEARVAYQLANAGRSGDVAAKRAALVGYWRAVLVCDTAVTLARARPGEPAPAG